MRRKLFRVLICTLLIAAFTMAPMSALAAKIYIVNTDGARLRSSSHGGQILTSLNKGTRVVYTGKKGGSMYYVRTAAGRAGYIYKGYLSAYGAAPTKQVYTVTSSTGFYRKSGKKPVRKGTLSKGTQVIVYETRGSWAYVKTLTGKSGYVKRSALRRK